jgi:hypothetical protein
MRRATLIGVLALAACGGERDRENTVTCGLQALAAANAVLDRFQAATTLLEEPPDGLLGVVPARVIGFGTGRALTAEGEHGIVAGFEGEGFPVRPGFGVVLVDDSTEAVRGIVIFETGGPADYPQIGTVSSATHTVPLYAMMVRWSNVSTEQCPLLRPLPADTARAAPAGN